MESITKALQRAKAAQPGELDFIEANLVQLASAGHGHHAGSDHGALLSEPVGFSTVSPMHLRPQHVIAYDSGDWKTRSYDVLRNQLSSDKDKLVHVVAVTAPTPGCGATVTAVNLAFSFARLRAANVLLVDANARSPAIGRVFGLPRHVHHNGHDASMALTTVEAGGIHVNVLRTVWDDTAKVPSATDTLRMMTQFERARQKLRPSVIILDVSPMLTADEAIPFVLEADSVALVLAVGQSKITDLEVCRTYLGSKRGVQVVLNKCGKHGL